MAHGNVDPAEFHGYLKAVRPGVYGLWRWRSNPPKNWILWLFFVVHKPKAIRTCRLWNHPTCRYQGHHVDAMPVLMQCIPKSFAFWWDYHPQSWYVLQMALPKSLPSFGATVINSHSWEYGPQLWWSAKNNWLVYPEFNWTILIIPTKMNI